MVRPDRFDNNVCMCMCVCVCVCQGERERERERENVIVGSLLVIEGSS